MNIIQRLLSINKYSRSGKKLKKVKGIVVHWIAVPYQSPETVIQFWENRKDQKAVKGYGAAHYVIGLDGTVFQAIPDDEVAYHVGANTYVKGIQEKLSAHPNNCTIGIEMCHTNTGFELATVNASIELIASLCKKNKITHENIFRHYDITRKDCPKFYVEDVMQWQAFKSKVRRAIKAA